MIIAVCAYFTQEVYLRLAKRPLVFDGRLAIAKHELTHYTPRNEVEGGYTGFTLFVRPSVRLSVCLSVRPSVRGSVSGW